MPLVMIGNDKWRHLIKVEGSPRVTPSYQIGGLSPSDAILSKWRGGLFPEWRPNVMFLNSGILYVDDNLQIYTD